MKKYFIAIIIFSGVCFAQNSPVYSSDFNTYVDTVKSKLDSLITLFNTEDFSSAAKQDSIEATLNAMQTLITSIDGKDFSTSAKQTETIDTLNSLNAQLVLQLTELQSLVARDFATSAKQDIIETTLNSIESLITTLNGYVDGVEASLTAIDTNTDRITTPGDTTITITTSATQLPDVAVKWFALQNPSSSINLFVGTDNGVSTTEYAFELAARMGVWGIEATNLNQYWARTASGSVSLKIYYKN